MPIWVIDSMADIAAVASIAVPPAAPPANEGSDMVDPFVLVEEETLPRRAGHPRARRAW